MRLDHGHLISAECRGFAQECSNLINWINCSSTSTTTTTTTVACVVALLLLGELFRVLLFWFLIFVGDRRDVLVSEGVDPHFLQFLLDVRVPVVLDLVVSSTRKVSRNLRPSACKERN